MTEEHNQEHIIECVIHSFVGEEVVGLKWLPATSYFGVRENVCRRRRLGCRKPKVIPLAVGEYGYEECHSEDDSTAPNLIEDIPSSLIQLVRIIPHIRRSEVLTALRSFSSFSTRVCEKYVTEPIIATLQPTVTGRWSKPEVILLSSRHADAPEVVTTPSVTGS